MPTNLQLDTLDGRFHEIIAYVTSAKESVLSHVLQPERAWRTG
jgi:hypothetical protein